MTVALGTTLIDLSIDTLLKKGEYARIEDGRTNGEDIAIGMFVTRHAETFPDIDLAGEIESIFGQVIAVNTSKHAVHANGPWYHDYDNPFANNIWVKVGILKPNSIYLCLSETNTTIAVGDKLKNADGVLKLADTSDSYQFTAEAPVTGASNTRKYFYARFEGLS